MTSLRILAALTIIALTSATAEAKMGGGGSASRGGSPSPQFHATSPNKIPAPGGKVKGNCVMVPVVSHVRTRPAPTKGHLPHEGPKQAPPLHGGGQLRLECK